MKFLLIIPAILTTMMAYSQPVNKPFIKLVEPTAEQNNVRTSRQFVVGSTCKSCGLSINDQPVKVYPTGAFAFELNLKPGDTAFNLVAFFTPGRTTGK